MTVEAHMTDKCRILSQSTSQAADGEIIGNYLADTAIKCRWATGSSIEQAAGSLLQMVTTHSVYLPSNTDVLRTNRIRLTHVGGQALGTPLEGAVNGGPLPAVGCIKVNLKEVVAVDG